MIGNVEQDHHNPGTPSEWLSSSLSAQQAGDFEGMLHSARKAYQQAPGQAEVSLRLAEACLLCGHVREAIDLLDELEPGASADPQLLQQLGELFTQCSQFGKANRCYRQAVKLRPADPPALYNLAASCIALGQLDQAEQLLNEVIRLAPTDYDAWQNRSTLRRQTDENNHVRQLQSVLGQLGPDDPGHVPLCYALARELEDLQRYGESFQYLQQGAVARRQRLDYNVDVDIAAMELIEQTFTPGLLRAGKTGHDSNRPVFILGLPRSGTTLVDRILSAHSQVASLGEINTLALALMRGVSESGGSATAVQTKSDLIKRASRIDFSLLGRRYAETIGEYGHTAERLIDKTPLNFLYLGLIRLALPNARIIHLRRHPVDSCYAMYKTLFRMGYPFSYSLQDVGRYYIAYHRLMAHWRTAAPGSFLDVDYEHLVNNQESESRRIVDWCGLEWEPGCLEFHKSSEPAATASAAQVRQAMYTSSVNLWRNYEQQLAPFVAKLREHGIEMKAFCGEPEQ